MNDYESDRTYRLFQDELGYEWTNEPSHADLVLFNTCSIREKADQKAFSALGRLKEAKKNNPDMVIAVGGCLAQSQGEDIKSKFKFVDIVFGTHQWASLPALVERVTDKQEKISELDLFSWKNYAFLPYRESKADHPISELVTIQNGCDKFCTFCLVPFTRGRQVSRTPKDILSEVNSLVMRGVKEVTLLGQNVNAYGVDRRSEMSFAQLLRELSDVKGLERLRFFTSHPAELTFDAIDAMAESPIICEHLHLPLQSGSDRILEKMNRNYSLSTYREIANYLKKRMPDIALTTDIIVGFPGETDEDFQKTLEAMVEFQFDDSYSFRFSPRLNTKAAQWVDQFVDDKVAKDRLRQLQALQVEIFQKNRVHSIGKELEVLVEGTSKRDATLMVGKTRQNKSVNFPGDVSLVGKLVYVRIDEMLANTFRGEMVSMKTLPVMVA